MRCLLLATVLLGYCAAAEPLLAPVLSLDAALRLAAARNETAAVAGLRLARARSARRVALAGLLPTAGLEAAHEMPAGADNDYNRWRGLASLPLIAPADFAAVRTANADLEAQGFDSIELRRGLAFETVGAYLDALAADQVLPAAERRFSVAEEALRVARRRQEAGLAERSEVTRSELDVAIARQAQVDAANARRLARIALAFVLAAPTDLDPRLDEPASLLLPANTPANDPARLATAALERRTDYRALRLRQRAALLAVDELRNRSLPNLSLEGSVADNASGPDSGREWRASLVGRWTLWDGGASWASAEGQRHAAAEIRLAVERLSRSIQREAAAATTDLSGAVAALAAAEVRARVAAQNAREIADRFGQGLATALQEADALAAAFEADTGLVRTRLRLRAAELEVSRVAGDWPLGRDPSVDPPVPAPWDDNPEGRP